MNDVVPGFSLTGQVLLDGEIFTHRPPIGTSAAASGWSSSDRPIPSSIFDNVTYGMRLNHPRSGADLAVKAEEALRAAGLWDEVKTASIRPRACSPAAAATAVHRPGARGRAGSAPFDDRPRPSTRLHRTRRGACLQLGRRLTVVIVTHNLHKPHGRRSDRVLLLGRLVEYAPTVTLFHKSA